MKRIAIILSRSLNAGEAGNVAAILMGQAAVSFPDIYALEPLIDRGGSTHAAIRCNVVVLEAGAGQIAWLADEARRPGSSVGCVVFTELGQHLSDSFPEYRERIAQSTPEELKIVGAVLVGESDPIRNMTRRFSLYKG